MNSQFLKQTDGRIDGRMDGRTDEWKHSHHGPIPQILKHNFAKFVSLHIQTNLPNLGDDIGAAQREEDSNWLTQIAPR